jgi:hypothetical protein
LRNAGNDEKSHPRAERVKKDRAGFVRSQSATFKDFAVLYDNGSDDKTVDMASKTRRLVLSPRPAAWLLTFIAVTLPRYFSQPYA